MTRFAAPLSLALILPALALAGCDSMTASGQTCFDYQGFPVACPTGGSGHTHKSEASTAERSAAPASAPAPYVAFRGSRNGSLVTDAQGAWVAFEAVAPHSAVLGGERAQELELTPEGRLLLLGREVGYVAYALTADDALVTVLVDATGLPLALSREAGRLSLEATEAGTVLATLDRLPYLSRAATDSGLPVVTLAEGVTTDELARTVPARPATR